MTEKTRPKTKNNEEIDSSELTQEECDLYDFFINEYNDLFENILNLKGKNIYSIIKNNVSLLIGKSNFNKYSKTSLKKVYNRLKEDYFEPDNIVIKYLKENIPKINIKDLPKLNIDSIFAHCNRCYESIHICGEPLYNYKYYDLIICIKCKMIYKKNMIRLLCSSCKEEYYSYTVNESNYKNDFFPATWEKYHCFSFNYDQITCPKCDSALYYSELKNLLKCFKCKWTSNPNKVLWECEICGEKFKSKIKEFVKYETKPEINSVKYALINRINARPSKCKCCGANPKSINFFHPNCDGYYYLSYLQKKNVVVCDKCKIILYPGEVEWGCGNCKKSFSCDKMIVLETAFKEGKYLERGMGLKYNTNNGFFSDKNKMKYLRRKTENNGICMTTQKNNNNKINNERIKIIKSQKLEFRPIKKLIIEGANDNSDLNVKKNLGNLLQTNNIDENDYKSHLEMIRKKFVKTNNDIMSNTSNQYRALKKNVSENRMNTTAYNRKRLTINSNNISIENITIDNIKKDKININATQIKSDKKLEKDITKVTKNEEFFIKERKKRIQKISKENSKNSISKELKPIKEINMKKLKTNDYPFSKLEKIYEYSDKKVKNINNNINKIIKYSRRNLNSVMENTSSKGLSQTKPKNIRLNFNLNININNILDNSNNSNKKLNYSIKQEEQIEPEENFNPKEFKLIEKIGFGSFGKIFKVKWIQNNKNYAMKIIDFKHFEDIEDTQKKLKIMKDFRRKTNSKGIIKTYGNLYEKIGKEEYKYYILMELARTDWEQEINSRSKKKLYYTQPELLDIIKQLVSCYALLQKNNISHRDVKPQNVLILDRLFKLCDFGEARNISGKNGYIHQPIRGSELYMSPILFNALNNNQLEVLHNSYKSDVFSLGMCFFLAATLSFDCLYEIREEKDMKTIKKILDKYLVPRYSRNLVDILYNMLQIDEEIRPNFIELEQYIINL